MTSRVSIPLAVCFIAAAVAVVLLARPADTPSAAPAPPTTVTTGDAPSSPAPAASAAIGIEGFAFTSGVTVEPGQTIEVANDDGAPHTLTSNDGVFSTGTIDGGSAGSIVAPTAAGTYGFFCEIHPSMTGSFTVAA